MAIIIHQEKKGINWLFIFSLFFIVAMIGVSAFYVFFIVPEKIDQKIVPLQLKAISDLENLKLDPIEFAKNEKFIGLKASIKLNIPDKSVIGKANPFQP